MENINPRRLSLVLLVLAIGCHVDVDRPNSAAIAEQYFHFGRVAACELPIVNDPNEDLLHAMVRSNCADISLGTFDINALTSFTLFGTC